MIDLSKYKIIIENPKGSYKSFNTESDPIWSSYPLKGVTYPVDYGYIDGYIAEDGAELDVFIGTGDVSGYIIVWRIDVPTETKMFVNLTIEELELIKKEFAPVLNSVEILNEDSFNTTIEKFKTKSS